MELKNELHDYQALVLICAEEKLIEHGKPSLSETSLISGIVSRLKKKDKKDKRHTNKVNFKKEHFNKLTQHDLWKEKIIQLADGSYILSSMLKTSTSNINTNCYQWSNTDYYQALDFTLQILKEMDEFEFESLVSKVLAKSFKNYKFEATKKTGDGGIDVIGIREDIKNPEKIELVFVQAKKFNKKEKVDISDAYKFITASRIKIKNEYQGKVSKFEGVFITTGCIGSSFEKLLVDGSESGFNFYGWDGERFAGKMIKHGMGVKYSIDSKFWSENNRNMNK